MTTATARPRKLGRVEFTALLAMSMALSALGIDLILPAFASMRTDFGLEPDSTAVAGTITAYFLGLAIAQLGYGPLADRYGRKPILFVGFAVYLVGALASTLAPSLTLLLVARFVWGLGAAGARVVTLSVVRDRFDGEEMARAMSFIMAVFILVPVVAPSLGAVVVAVGSWRWAFAACVILTVAMAVWALRLEESLDPANRMELSFDRVRAAAKLVVTNRLTMGYTLALTALFGPFISYLASSEIIFGDVFDAASIFPLLFGATAAVMGAAMLANAFVVRRFGTRRLAHALLIVDVVAAGAFAGMALVTDGRPSLVVFMAGLVVIMACHAFLLPNFNTIAMDPMGAIAGTASAVIGTVSTAGGAVLGAVIDQAFDGSIKPLAFGFAGFGLLALVFVLWAEGGKMFEPLRPRAG